MFSLPVPDGWQSGKSSLTERKLRYRYFNQTHKYYQRLANSRGNDRKILDPQHNESEEEDDGSDLEHYNKEERKYFKRYDKPQDSYEVWNNNSKKRRRVPLQRHMVSYSDVSEVEEYGKSQCSHLLHSNRKLVDDFHNRIDGYELLKEPAPIRHIDLKVIQTLTQLLHLNISRRNWGVAYRIFAQMIRLPEVDIRSIWNLGVEVMSHCPDNEGGYTREGSLDFLEWMSKVYSSRARFVEGINYKMAPAFRSGSRNHTPKYVTTLLWKSLVYAARQIFDEEDDAPLDALIEKIDEMLIIPTYMEDSEVWFIQAMAHVVKTDYLTRPDVNEDNERPYLDNALRNDVTTGIKSAEKCLAECSLRTGDGTSSFEYPEKYIRRQLRLLEDRIMKKDE
ncbi:Rrn11 protein [Maudiozyma humilis]|uniref:Rrn11 protein n=1 Tax=Maudiozyma humilis TaxID=51915 RepID=A0AAV5RZF9_MAUHU|nr:Rrn11 protein [Kazachstania humilis]